MRSRFNLTAVLFYGSLFAVIMTISAAYVWTVARIATGG